MFRLFSFTCPRLTPDAFEARAYWWVSSRPFFDGHIHEPPQIPSPVNLHSRDDPAVDIYRRIEEQDRVLKELKEKNVAHEEMYNKMNREEFCLVTGLRFGVDFNSLYLKGPIPFRRRVFDSAMDGYHISTRMLEAKIMSEHFHTINDHDAVSLCLLAILELVLLGQERRHNVPGMQTLNAGQSFMPLRWKKVVVILLSIRCRALHGPLRDLDLVQDLPQMPLRLERTGGFLAGHSLMVIFVNHHKYHLPIKCGLIWRRLRDKSLLWPMGHNVRSGRMR
nr:phospholipase-like protein [Tanacetum cinerariifolium]